VGPDNRGVRVRVAGHWLTGEVSTTAQRAAERAADRNAHLTRVDEPVPAAGPIPPLVRTDASVAAYLATLTGLDSVAVDAVLDTLAAFCARLGETPDSLVEGIFERVEYRYLRRAEFTEAILAFAAAGGGEWAQQKARGDVVRAFFHANGHRIAPARVPWQVWAQMP
jgi:hypothetical protein